MHKLEDGNTFAKCDVENFELRRQLSTLALPFWFPPNVQQQHQHVRVEETKIFIGLIHEINIQKYQTNPNVNLPNCFSLQLHNKHI